jgi:hypothetical protein
MRLAVSVFDHVPDPIGVVTLVGDDVGPGRQFIEKKLGHRRITHLARREFELHRQTVADNPGMKLGRQSSTASTDTSISSLFFWAAAC